MVKLLQVKEELHAAKRDASRQHARELQLDLTQAHMANAALRLQVRSHLLPFDVPCHCYRWRNQLLATPP